MITVNFNKASPSTGEKLPSSKPLANHTCFPTTTDQPFSTSSIQSLHQVGIFCCDKIYSTRVHTEN